MREFNQKKRYKKFLYSPITIFFVFILLVSLLKGLWGVYTKESLSRDNLKREQVELNKLIQREENLAQVVEYLKTHEGIEAEIRNKFRMVKEGESISVILEQESTSTPEVISTPTPSFWDKVTNFLGF